MGTGDGRETSGLAPWLGGEDEETRDPVEEKAVEALSAELDRLFCCSGRYAVGDYCVNTEADCKIADIVHGYPAGVRQAERLVRTVLGTVRSSGSVPPGASPVNVWSGVSDCGGVVRWPKGTFRRAETACWERPCCRVLPRCLIWQRLRGESLSGRWRNR